jgi:hypothetical protein
MVNEPPPSAFSKTERDGRNVSCTHVSELVLADFRLYYSEGQIRLGSLYKPVTWLPVLYLSDFAVNRPSG